MGGSRSALALVLHASPLQTGAPGAPPTLIKASEEGPGNTRCDLPPCPPTFPGMFLREACLSSGVRSEDGAYTLSHSMLNPQLGGWPPSPWQPGVELISAVPLAISATLDLVDGGGARPGVDDGAARPGPSSTMPPVIFLHGAFHSAAVSAQQPPQPQPES